MFETIKSSTEISHIFSQGKRYNVLGLTLMVLDNHRHDQNGRVAFIAGKRNGNAVWRNSAKRRMRALCNELGGPWDGKDIIFLAARNILDVPYIKVLSSCKKAIDSIVRHKLL